MSDGGAWPAGEKLDSRACDAAGGLTDQEHHVAQLARDGLINRDIGARLFISVHTMEWHLHKVLVKLGIKSRNELGIAMGAER